MSAYIWHMPLLCLNEGSNAGDWTSIPGTSTVSLSLSTPRLHFDGPDFSFEDSLLGPGLKRLGIFQRRGVAPLLESSDDDICAARTQQATNLKASFVDGAGDSVESMARLQFLRR